MVLGLIRRSVVVGSRKLQARAAARAGVSLRQVLQKVADRASRRSVREFPGILPDGLQRFRRPLLQRPERDDAPVLLVQRGWRSAARQSLKSPVLLEPPVVQRDSSARRDRSSAASRRKAGARRVRWSGVRPVIRPARETELFSGRGADDFTDPAAAGRRISQPRLIPAPSFQHRESSPDTQRERVLAPAQPGSPNRSGRIWHPAVSRRVHNSFYGDHSALPCRSNCENICGGNNSLSASTNCRRYTMRPCDRSHAEPSRPIVECLDSTSEAQARSLDPGRC